VKGGFLGDLEIGSPALQGPIKPFPSAEFPSEPVFFDDKIARVLTDGRAKYANTRLLAVFTKKGNSYTTAIDDLTGVEKRGKKKNTNYGRAIVGEEGRRVRCVEGEGAAICQHIYARRRGMRSIYTLRVRYA
jgi:hypothetical protein